MVLCLSPLFCFDFRIKFIYIAFSDLFSCFRLQNLGKEFPVFAYFFDHLFDDLVFFRFPNFLLVSRDGESSESMKTLILIAFWHETGNDAPLFGMVLI